MIFLMAPAIGIRDAPLNEGLGLMMTGISPTGIERHVRYPLDRNHTYLPTLLEI